MPIHDRIPREIFEAILHLCVGSEKPVRDLETLQLVCRTWRDIIAEASFLWGTITAFEGRRAFHKALRMANDSSLDIIFLDVYLDLPVGMKIDQLDFFTEAGQKIDQWRSLEIKADNLQDALAFIQSQNPPPKLELLHIESDNDYYPQERPGGVLFRGAPVTRLKHLKLSRAPITDIVTVLNNRSTLTTLRLAGFEDALLLNQLATDEPNPSPIHLPSLIDIELVDLHFSSLDLLLSNLVVSQLRSLHVIDDPPVIARLLALKTGNLNTTLTSVTSGARSYEIVWYGGCKITIGGLVIHLAWKERRRVMDNLNLPFGGLSDHLRGLGLANLALHLTFQFYVPILSDLEWFTRKANVTSLTFASGAWRCANANTGIPLLSQPTSGPSPIWLLPQLEVFKIDIATTKLRHMVVDMIKARHAAVLDSLLGAHGMVPKLFKEIWLYHYGDCPIPLPRQEIITEMVQAAKGADVHWEGPKAHPSNPML